MRLLQRRSRGNPRRPGPMRRWAHGVGHALVAEAASGSLVACSCAAPLLAFQARGELAWRLLEVRRDGLRCTACSAAGAVGQGVSTKRCRNHLRWTLGHITANVGSTGRGSTVVSMLRRDTPAYSAPTAGICLRSWTNVARLLLGGQHRLLVSSWLPSSHLLSPARLHALHLCRTVELKFQFPLPSMGCKTSTSAVSSPCPSWALGKVGRARALWVEHLLTLWDVRHPAC